MKLPKWFPSTLAKLTRCESDCKFCYKNKLISQNEVVAQTKRAYLIEAGNSPVKGCYLIIPKKHYGDVLPWWWQREVNKLRRRIPWYARGVPHNTSVNHGREAGQRLLGHAHEWVIPRLNPALGDVGLATLLAERLSK